MYLEGVEQEFVRALSCDSGFFEPDSTTLDTSSSPTQHHHNFHPQSPNTTGKDDIFVGMDPLETAALGDDEGLEAALSADPACVVSAATKSSSSTSLECGRLLLSR